MKLYNDTYNNHKKKPKQKKHAKTTPRNIIIKFSETRNKEEILNASRGKKDTV